MTERICFRRISPFPACCLPGSRQRTLMRRLRVGGFLATGHGLLARLVGDGVDFDPPFLGHAPRRGEVHQPVERGPDHIMRVRGSQALGEDVAHPRALEHSAHRPARDHAGPRRRRPEDHAPRPAAADDLVRDGAAGERHLGQAAARCLHGLAHRFAHLVRLAGGDADATLPVAHGDQGIEAEAPAAFDNLGDAIDRDHVLEDAVAFARRAVIAPLPTPAATAAAAAAATAATTTTAPLASTTPAAATATTTTATTAFRGPRLFATRRDGFRRGGDRGRRGFAFLVHRHQNSNPPLRAPSATAFTRPWYW